MSITRIPLNRFWHADSWEPPTGDEIRVVMNVGEISIDELAALLGMTSQRHAVDEWLEGAAPIPYAAWAILCNKARLGKIWDSGPAPTMTLEELCRPVERKERRLYEKFEVTTTSNPFACVIEVNLALLSVALKGDSIWAASAAERNAETFRPDRYARVHQEFMSGETVYMPWLSFKTGRTAITDGRHRLYALIDLGFTHCPVVADSNHVAPIMSLVRSEP